MREHQQLAQRLGRDPSTVTRWLQKYRQGGLSELLEIKIASTMNLNPNSVTKALWRLQIDGSSSREPSKKYNYVIFQ